MKKIIVFITGSLMLGLQACGQTGPLYYPDAKPPIHVEPEES